MLKLHGLVLILVTITPFAAAIWFFYKAACHFIHMRLNTKGAKQDIAMNLVPLVATFLPSIYTKAGQHHLRRFFGYSFRFLICLGIIVVFLHFTEPAS